MDQNHIAPDQLNPRDAREMPRSALGEMTLRDTLAPLFRHRKLVTVCFLGIFLIGGLIVLLAPNHYRAHMQVLVKRARLEPVVTSEPLPQTVQAAPPVTDEEINSEVELLRTEDLLRQVVLATGLSKPRHDSRWAFFFPKTTGAQRIAEAVNQLARHLDVTALKKTDVINVSYRSTDPRLAHRVLSTLAKLYLKKHLAVYRPAGAFRFFQHETKQYRNSLREAEAHLAEFESTNQINSVRLQADLTQHKLSSFDKKLRETQTEISGTQSRIVELESQLRSTPSRLSTTEKESDNSQLLQVLGGTLATLELKRTEMSSNYQPTYRPYKELQGQIAEAQAQIKAVKSAPLRVDTTDVNPTYLSLTDALAKSRANLATFQAKAAATNRNIQFYRGMAGNLARQELEQEDLARNVKADAGNYLLYLNKREQARISDALDSRRILNVAIAEPPTVPALPVNSRERSLLVVLAIAAVVGVGAGFVSDYIDPTLRSADETEHVLEVPVLAAMPKVQKGSKGFGSAA